MDIQAYTSSGKLELFVLGDLSLIKSGFYFKLTKSLTTIVFFLTLFQSIFTGRFLIGHYDPDCVLQWVFDLSKVMRVIINYIILGMGISLIVLFTNELQACGSANASPITHSEGYCAEVEIGDSGVYISTCAASHSSSGKSCWYVLHKE